MLCYVTFMFIVIFILILYSIILYYIMLYAISHHYIIFGPKASLLRINTIPREAQGAPRGPRRRCGYML